MEPNIMEKENCSQRFLAGLLAGLLVGDFWTFAAAFGVDVRGRLLGEQLGLLMRLFLGWTLLLIGLRRVLANEAAEALLLLLTGAALDADATVWRPLVLDGEWERPRWRGFFLSVALLDGWSVLFNDDTDSHVGRTAVLDGVTLPTCVSDFVCWRAAFELRSARSVRSWRCLRSPSKSLSSVSTFKRPQLLSESDSWCERKMKRGRTLAEVSSSCGGVSDDSQSQDERCKEKDNSRDPMTEDSTRVQGGPHWRTNSKYWPVNRTDRQWPSECFDNKPFHGWKSNWIVATSSLLDILVTAFRCFTTTEVNTEY